MAEGGEESDNNPGAGFDDSIFVKPPDSKLLCTICRKVSKTPYQTPCCHRFCQDCLLNLIVKEKGKCPKCQAVIEKSKISPDYIAAGEIFSLLIHCPNLVNGCQQKTKLKAEVVHRKVCNYELISCETCSKSLPRNKMNEHSKECCSKHSQQDSSSTNSLQRTSIGESKLGQVSCQFANIGCSFKDINENIGKHYTNLQSIIQHQLYLNRKIIQMDETCQQINKLRETVNTLSRNLAQIEQRIQIPRPHFSETTTSNELICFGRYIWKITPFNEFHMEALSGLVPYHYSIPFYLNPNSYKLCVRVNLNGSTDNKNGYMSMFIHFMKGDYDECLTWPFQGTIVFKVVGFDEQEDFVKNTKTPPGRLIALSRPKEELNTKGFGYVHFIPVGDLTKYVKNNTLILCVQIIEDHNIL